MTPRQKAGLDQTAAMLREARRKVLWVEACARRARDTWWREPLKLRVLLLDLMRDESADECRRLVGEILSRPWNWRAEYVCAECRARDTEIKVRIAE